MKDGRSKLETLEVKGTDVLPLLSSGVPQKHFYWTLKYVHVLLLVFQIVYDNNSKISLHVYKFTQNFSCFVICYLSWMVEG